MDPKNEIADHRPFEGADTPVESTAAQPITGLGELPGQTAFGVCGLTQIRPAGSLGQFKIHLVKPLARFLTLPYLRAQRILHLARTVDVFHMQSIFIARQALHLVILLNDLVDQNEGPDDEQHEERIALEDELIELLGAMKEWGVDQVDAVYEQHCQKIRRHYAIIFKERFYFHESRDPASDPIYQRLSAYDEKTISFRNWKIRHVDDSMEVDRPDSLAQQKEVDRARRQENTVVDDADELENSLSEVLVNPPGSLNNHAQPAPMAGEVLSWTSSDPRSSVLFNSNFGVNYRFVTEVDNRNVSTTTLWRAVSQSRENKLAKFEWTSNGSLGRATIGRTTISVSELLRPVHGNLHSSTRFFSGPDGRIYTWASSATGECILHDSDETKVAFFRPVRPTRYQLGDVYGELHFCIGQSTTMMSPPLMDMICMTAMVYRVLVQWG